MTYPGRQYTVITVRGTGEQLNGESNLLRAVTLRLERPKFPIFVDLPYPASIGIMNPNRNLAGVSMQQSLATGEMALAAEIRRTPNPVVLLGYSLGAMVVTRFLESQAGGEFDDCEVAFAANIANPLRRLGDSVDQAGAPGFGIAGQREPFTPWQLARYVEVANPRDGITCCPADSPLRTAADGLSNYSFAVGGGWSADLVDRILRRRWQPVGLDWLRDPLGAWRSHAFAAEQVRDYLTGQHGPAYVTGGYTARLADLINERVK